MCALRCGRDKAGSESSSRVLIMAIVNGSVKLVWREVTLREVNEQSEKGEMRSGCTSHGRMPLVTTHSSQMGRQRWRDQQQFDTR